MYNNKKVGCGSRLIKIRQILNLSQKELASILNISVGHMCDLEHSRKNVTNNNVRLLTLLLDVNEQWFKTGVGGVFIKKNINNSIIDMLSNVLNENDDSFKKQFLLSLAQFDNEQWNALSAIHQVINRHTDKQDII